MDTLPLFFLWHWCKIFWTFWKQKQKCLMRSTSLHFPLELKYRFCESQQQPGLTLIKSVGTCWRGQVSVCVSVGHGGRINLNTLRLDTEGGSGNLFLAALTAHCYCSGWITAAMVLTGWFTDSRAPSTRPFSAKLDECNVANWGSASCSIHMCPRK